MIWDKDIVENPFPEDGSVEKIARGPVCYIDGYQCSHPYSWRGKNLTRRIVECLGRFRGDPDLTKFYLNALSAEKNKQSKRTKEH